LHSASKNFEILAAAIVAACLLLGRVLGVAVFADNLANASLGKWAQEGEKKSVMVVFRDSTATDAGWMLRDFVVCGSHDANSAANCVR